MAGEPEPEHSICSCGQSYTGQTCRNLVTQIQEHLPNQKSDVAMGGNGLRMPMVERGEIRCC